MAGVYVEIRVFLTLALAGEWSASSYCRLTTRETAFSTHCIGARVGRSRCSRSEQPTYLLV
jgi:hypothetical protein